MVPHSLEGGLFAAWGVLASQVRPRKSWTFTIAKNGDVYQHYEVTANTWHGGDTDNDGGVRANIDLEGWEHEGVRGEPLTQEQVVATSNLYLWHEQTQGWRPYRVWDTVFEHGWVSDSPTACPSHRIPHDTIAATIMELKGGNMEDTELLDAIKAVEHLVRTRGQVLIKTATSREVYVTDGIYVRYVATMTELYVYRLSGLETHTIPDDYMQTDRKRAIAEYLRWK
jgi:hypothetical protein